MKGIYKPKLKNVIKLTKYIIKKEKDNGKRNIR